MKKQVLALLVLTNLMAGCQGGGNDTPNSGVQATGGEGPKTEGGEGVSSSERPSLAIERNELTNELKVLIRPGIVDILSIKRLDFGTGKVEEYQLHPGQDFEDVVPAGDSILPWVLKYSVKAGRATHTFEVKEYKDLKIDSRLNLSLYLNSTNSLRFRNIKLGRNAILSTEGRNVVVTAEYLEAEVGSVIENLSEKSAALPARELQEGKYGGNITLSVRKIEGYLKINMRGGKGGPGVRGYDVADSDRGSAGAEGGGARANPGTRGNVRLDIPGIEAYCISEAADGTKGGKGKSGGPGARGEKGGGTGNLMLQIDETNRFYYEVTSTPGEPGEGGPGGKGGLGGVGGAPGKRADVCARVPSAGAEGDRGDNGAQGARGELGDLNQSCIHKGDQYSCTVQRFVKGVF